MNTRINRAKILVKTVHLYQGPRGVQLNYFEHKLRLGVSL
jgi:hypothetical protein